MLRPSPTVVVACLAGMGRGGQDLDGGARRPSGRRPVPRRPAARRPARGSREPVPAHEALGRLIRAVGISTDVRPDDIDEAAARFRPRLAGQQVLVVLDDEYLRRAGRATVARDRRVRRAGDQPAGAGLAPTGTTPPARCDEPRTRASGCSPRRPGRPGSGVSPMPPVR